MRRVLSLLAVVVLLQGCAAEKLDSKEEAGLMLDGLDLNGVTVNGIALNGIALNGIALNGIALNGIALNGIALNGIALNGIALNGIALNGIALNGYVATDPATLAAFESSEIMAEVFPYLVRCAAAPGDVVIIAPEDMADAIVSGKPAKEDDVFPLYGEGGLGLTPEWLEGHCDNDCREVLLACLGGHANSLGAQMLFSMGHPTRLERTDCEADLFRKFEASYFGERFSYAKSIRTNGATREFAIHGVDVDLMLGSPPVNSEPIAGAPIGVAARACLGVDDCFIHRVGWAQVPTDTTCGKVEQNACTSADATVCTNQGFCEAPPNDQPWFDEILWVFRPNRSVDIEWERPTVKHYDFQGEWEGNPGAPILEAATLCYQKLRAEPTMAHCFAKDYKPTACDDPKTFGKPTKEPGYYDDCKQWTLENCGPENHKSLLEEGPPIPFGYSDCADAVAGQRISCAMSPNYGGWWDKECVALAENGCLPLPESEESCSDECSAGATSCTGDDLLVCGDLNGDGCTEWTTVPCGPGRACEASTGTCEPTCTDECAPGAQQCTATGSGVESCEDSDGDGCYEWTSGVTCALGTACNPATMTCEDSGICLPIGSPECSDPGGEESQQN